MSRGAWLAAIAAGLLLIVGVGIALAASGADDDDVAAPSGPISDALAAAEPAGEPFPTMTRTSVRIGDRDLDVVLADEGNERYQGLRQREDIGPFDGMLFVFDGPTSTSFTMSTVPVPLDIGFYDERGRVVDQLLMKPCPDPSVGCPSYPASGEFTYALETLKGDLPEGPLSG